MVNGVSAMTHVSKALYAALLVCGLAGIGPIPAIAGGYHWDANCNCRRPDYQYTTKRYVRAAPRVVTHERLVSHTRVVPGRTRLVQENRVTVHVRPVIDREVIVHRTHTIVRNVVLHRVNRINRFRNEYYHQVINVNGGNTVREVTVHRNLRAANRYRGHERPRYSSYYRHYRHHYRGFAGYGGYVGYYGVAYRN